MRPPPAPSPLSPGGLGPGEAHAAGRTMHAAGPCAPAGGWRPSSDSLRAGSRPQCGVCRGRAGSPSPAALRGPGRLEPPRRDTVGRVCRGGGKTRRGWRGATRVTFSCFLGRVNSPPGDGDSPHGSSGWGKDHAALAKFLGDCVGYGSPGKGPGTGKGNDYYLGGGVWAREPKLPKLGSLRSLEGDWNIEGWGSRTVCRNYGGEGYFAGFALGAYNMGGRGRTAGLVFWWLLNL